MKSFFVAIAALAATVVTAQNNIVSITSPLMNAVYTAGQDAVISWINPTVDTIPKIMLAKGDPLALEVVATIAENVDAKKGSYTWKIPADTAPGNDYAFELGVSPDMSFSGMFAIKAAAAESSPAAASTTTTTTRTTTTVAPTTASTAASSVVSEVSSVASSATSAASSAASSVASVATSAVSSVASAASSVASSVTASATTTPNPETEQPAEENAGNKMGSNKAVLVAIAGVAAAALI
ncbi:hypothetical protein BDF21DRAFT_497253 [Thamnidium elegans]|uniref:Yeast cell wall synthesis Kre9/Knh1-like N-terminal domain-containing protein n=1 Tax=Thamnidium elegans TaxID=101142 RepID=A0A8H7VXR8_9FUNG|nr:hypothetical protein INT48_007928 [Thamnidium elegans]KAI8061325.1 hypothetical protein BDF21DRAFT_497253 [Thamnidium elegans]